MLSNEVHVALGGGNGLGGITGNREGVVDPGSDGNLTFLCYIC